MLLGLKELVVAIQTSRRIKREEREEALLRRAGASGIYPFTRRLLDRGESCRKVERLLAKIEKDLLPRALKLLVLSECRHWLNEGNLTQAYRVVEDTIPLRRERTGHSARRA